MGILFRALNEALSSFNCVYGRVVYHHDFGIVDLFCVGIVERLEGFCLYVLKDSLISFSRL